MKKNSSDIDNDNIDNKKIDKKIASALEKLIQVQRILLWDVAKKEKISPIQIQFLNYINTYPENLCKVSNLAREFDLTKATVSDALNSLEDKELLTKTREQDDKRSYILELTAEGKKLVNRIKNWQHILIEHIESFSYEEKEATLLFLMKLIKSLYENNIINIARMCIVCENFQYGEKNHYCKLTKQYLTNSDLDIGCQFHKSYKTGS